MADKADPLTRACERVGRFFYHFGRVELQLDAAITKLLGLEAEYAPIVTSSMDFFKKISVVQCAVDLQTKSGKKVSIDTKELFGELVVKNEQRRTVAHSAFEAEGEGVRFKRAEAKKELKHVDPHWDENKFSEYFEVLKRLEKELEQVVRELEHIDWSVFPATFFSSSVINPPWVFQRPAGLTDAVRTTTEGKRETPTPAREGD